MTIAEIRKELKEYKINKARLEKLKMELNEITTLPGISFQPKSDPTHKFNSMTENIVVKKEKIESEINSLQYKIHILELALNALNETEKKIITMKYIDEYNWKYISYKTIMPIRTCKEISHKAIEKMLKVV